jgi:hypothetical protein
VAQQAMYISGGASRRTAQLQRPGDKGDLFGMEGLIMLSSTDTERRQ